MSNERLFDVNKDLFDEHFPHQPFIVEHNLVSHPLFEIQRLIQLAKDLPADSVEYNAGDLPVSQDPSQTPMTGLSPEETLQRIEECKSWMVLKNLEQDPDFNKLMLDCLSPVEEYCKKSLPGTTLRESFVFISSPGSVTPYHIDPEHNFLLQIRGQKLIHIWNPFDSRVISEQELERFHGDAEHRNKEYKPAYEAHERQFTLNPGIGLHFPVTAPHWVKNGEEVSISYSITWRSSYSERKRRLYQANHWLRTKGITPRQVGKSPTLDIGKDFAFRVYRRMSRLVGGSKEEGHPA